MVNRKAILIIILLSISFIALYPQFKTINIRNSSEEIEITNKSEQKIDTTIKSVVDKQNNNILDAKTYKGLHNLIGQSADEIKQMWGKPLRIDPSSYDYVWWIYQHNENSYIQVGVLENKVVTVFAVGSDVNVDPFYIGQPYEEIVEYSKLENSYSIDFDDNSYRFELTDEEIHARPLVQFGEVWAQLYIDQFTKKLSSIRYLDGPTLVKQRPYELVYRGDLLSARELTKEEWKAVEKGNSLQIIDITNMIRKRHELGNVLWHEETSKVAFLHSKDMKENNYFSHESPTKGGLADRLEAGNIKYHMAGENIAAKYVDGIAAVEGWLNSKGHRETLLNKEFTHLGVGVFEKYYTQNFISTWEIEY